MMEPTKIDKKNIAGVVVLYDSPNETICNIATYINQIERLYVVDNSAQPNNALIKELKLYSNVHYHLLNGNEGIAVALNWAVNQAIMDKFSVLLTMDDDTRTPVGMIQQMIKFWNQYPNPIGILSGVHHTNLDNALYRKILYTLTSGNLLNLVAYQVVGPFRDDLFIDHVDHEYGLRLNENGYQVIELPSIRLDHQLGYTKPLKIGPYVVGTYGSHSPVRLYYFARNGVYIGRQYFTRQPFFAWTVFKELIKRWIKALFLQDNRGERVNMLLTGVKDGWAGKLGKYNHHLKK